MKWVLPPEEHATKGMDAFEFKKVAGAVLTASRDLSRLCPACGLLCSF
jgi:hypothetical protein